MKINRAEFIKVLNSVKPGLATKELVEQSMSFIFKGGQVITYNDEVAVHAPLKDDFEVDGAVPAKEFLAILGKFKGEDVELEPLENELRLKCGKSKAGIPLSGNIVLPISDINIPDEWYDLPNDFMDAIKACLPSTSRDLTRPVLTTIHLNNDFAESTDNARITRWTWTEDAALGADDFLLPAEAATALTRFDAVEYRCEDGWAHFSNGKGVVFSCRISEGNFPNIDEHIVGGTSIGKIIFPEGMAEMLDRAGVFANNGSGAYNPVNISIDKKGLMVLRGEGDSGWYEESCRVKWDGDSEIAFSIHQAHLQDILKTTSGASIGDGKILFETDNFVHLVALEAK